MQKYFLKLIIIPLALIFLHSFSSAQTTLAILDFEGRNISQGEALTLTDRFRNEIIKTNKYIVVERGAMEEILEEQGFQQTGCTSNECVVEVGQLLGVQQMISGSIGKVGDIFTVSVRIIDIRTGEIINVIDYDHSGDLGKLLTVGMRMTAQRLVGIKGAPKNLDNTLPAQIRGQKYSQSNEGTVTDIDGNTYQTIQIGAQVWMAENLKVTHYRDGTAIPTGHSNSDWSNLTTGAYAVYDDNETNADTYGYLYNWYAVDDSRNIAPAGWHVPTDDEWKTLEMYLGMSQNEADDTGWRGTDEGGKLKEAGTEHWNSQNTGATNESGFTALPGGYLSYGNGNYVSMGNNGYFWSSAESGSDYAWYRILYYGNSAVDRFSFNKQNGFSVRCVRD